MPRAATVIVGAGIVGASVAYHLAHLGRGDILVVDRGSIPRTPGSTSHAPGGVVAMSHNHLLARMSFYSTDLYRRLEPFPDARRTYHPVGSIELARTEERMADLVREHGEAMAYGASTSLLEPEEVVARVPYMDPEVVVGGLFIRDSAIVSGTNVAAALLRDAVDSGAVAVQADTLVVDIEGEDSVTAVLTADGGRIETDEVVLCTNIWSLPLRRRLQHLPLMAFEHQYVETDEVLDNFDPTDPDHEMTVPTVRDLDVGLYYRHHWNRIGVGSYHHPPLAVSPDSVGESADRPFTAEHFGDAWKEAVRLIPSLERSRQFVRSFNGMFAFTVDGMPIIGESSLKGMWLAIGSWITHAGGVGKSTAELIESGESEWDLREASIDRFHPHQVTPWFVRTATMKNYREVYEIHHPVEPPSEPRGVRHSPLALSLEAFEPHSAPFGGVELARWYGANQRLLDRYRHRIPSRSEWASRHWSPIAGAEHLACRDGAALFDLTGLSIIEVGGRGAQGFVDHLCSNRMDVDPGRVVYTLWLTPGGGIKRDLTVARLDRDRYWMFVGEGTRPQDLAWVQHHAADQRDVVVTDVSDAYAAVGLWGPDAPTVLREVVSEDPGLGYFAGGWSEIGPAPVYAMRISYVGEAGYELHFPADQARTVFERLWTAGEHHGMVMAGSAAMDSLRIEKGYRLWGSDIHTEHDPYQAGLGWVVRLDKEGFVGQEAARRLSASVPERRLCCLVLESGDPLGNEPVVVDGQVVGRVTSAAYGYSVGASIAYGYLSADSSVAGSGVEVLVEGRSHRAEVCPEPLWDPAGRRLR